MKKKIIVSIIGAALIGGITKATQFFPDIVDILVAGNVLITAIVVYVTGQKEA